MAQPRGRTVGDPARPQSPQRSKGPPGTSPDNVQVGQGPALPWAAFLRKRRHGFFNLEHYPRRCRPALLELAGAADEGGEVLGDLLGLPTGGHEDGVVDRGRGPDAEGATFHGDELAGDRGGGVGGEVGDERRDVVGGGGGA